MFMQNFAAIFLQFFYSRFLHNYEESFQKVKGKILVKKGHFYKFEGWEKDSVDIDHHHLNLLRIHENDRKRNL